MWILSEIFLLGTYTVTYRFAVFKFYHIRGSGQIFAHMTRLSQIDRKKEKYSMFLKIFNFKFLHEVHFPLNCV